MKAKIKQIRTRFAPSPTGYIHLGNARAALFNAWYAYMMKGQFILRIEDTDLIRSHSKYVQTLQDDLHWLGLVWEEGPGHSHLAPLPKQLYGPYFQSQRQTIYNQYYHQLKQQQSIYPCFCSEAQLKVTRQTQLAQSLPPRYLGTCRSLSAQQVNDYLAEGKKPAWRFKIPAPQNICFIDLIKGTQSFDTRHMGDFIIYRADGTPSFLFCNAIDDALMAISHILRGEDHLTNTPRQILLLQALQLPIPQYGHLSLILEKEGTPLSKRAGSCSIDALHKQGFLALAIINYLARLGHTLPNEVLYSFPELARHFHLDQLTRSAAAFDTAHLLYWQKKAVQQLSFAHFWKWVGEQTKNKVPEISQELFVHILKNNVLFPTEVFDWATILFNPSKDKDQLLFGASERTIIAQAGQDFFIVAQEAAKKFSLQFAKMISQITHKLPHCKGKQLFMPLRVALTGKTTGPELDSITQLLGTKRLLQRLKQAEQSLSSP